MSLTIEQIKKIEPKVLLKIIERAKKSIKNNDIMKDVFKKYNIDINEIDNVPIAFKDLNVSARTEKGVIYLNYRLLCNGDLIKISGYLIHELTHYAQQTSGSKPKQNSTGKDYLDNKLEEEGFQNQIGYIAETKGKDSSEKYVDQVLDHHDVKDSKREDKKEKLMKKVE